MATRADLNAKLDELAGADAAHAASDGAAFAAAEAAIAKLEAPADFSAEIDKVQAVIDSENKGKENADSEKAKFDAV